MKLFFSLSFQDSMSPLMNHISFFHDHVMVIMLMILSVVIYVLSVVVFFPCFSRFFKSNETLEGLWTILPCLVLGSLAAPSLVTLYLADEISSSIFCLKVVGHQWFWSYESSDLGKNLSWESYLVPSSSMSPGDFRLLEVDKSIFFPLSIETRVIVTSSDVIHSWCIPSMGVKMDAVPGRLNQFYVFPSRVGVVYGQCSEICGSLHSFMPIKAEIVPLEIFFKKLSSIGFSS